MDALFNAKIIKLTPSPGGSQETSHSDTTEITSGRKLKHRIVRNNEQYMLFHSSIFPFKWNRGIYQCWYCPEQYLELDLLKQHKSESHFAPSLIQIRRQLIDQKGMLKVDISDISCKLCTDEISDLAQLAQHLKHKHDKPIDLDDKDVFLPFSIDKDFRCVVCKETFQNLKHLLQHMNKHYANFICDQCSAGFKTVSQMMVHRKTHGTTSFKCEICYKCFKTLHTKTQHISIVHNQLYKNKCHQCQERFATLTQKMNHMASVHGVEPTYFQCSACPKKFLLSSPLKRHINEAHLKIKKFQCDQCEFKSITKSGLTDHVIVHNGSPKIHECVTCKKSYARKKSLAEHMKIHIRGRQPESP